MGQAQAPLGQAVEYKTIYDASLLFPIARSIGRESIGFDNNIRFFGYDIWNCYELSWLNQNGKPEIAVAKIIVPATSTSIVESNSLKLYLNSTSIVESKSLKLYLNSLNNTKYSSRSDVQDIITRDLSNILGCAVEVALLSVKNLHGYYGPMDGENIDDVDIECSEYDVNKKLLALDAQNTTVSEVLYSNLLRANCPVTNQPDWASIQVSYTGKKVDRTALLKYIISFRNHSGFHEQCVENIFIDMLNICNPEKLTVYARFTRRGGIDINPIRSTHDIMLDITNDRVSRQ